MALDSRCDPYSNPFFQLMLRRTGFDFERSNLTAFKNPETGTWGGVCMEYGCLDMVLALYPHRGTGVLPCPARLVSEKIYVLGSVMDDPCTVEFIFRDGLLLNPRGVLTTFRYHKYNRFTSFGSGIQNRDWGFYNPDPTWPLAIRIARAFRT